MVISQSLDWRRANKADEILNTFTPPEAFVKYYSMNHIGTDKFDCPRKERNFKVYSNLHF